MEGPLQRFGESLSLLVSPEFAEFLREKVARYGAGASGVLFGLGAWLWLDALVVSPDRVPFTQHLPGVIALVALLMMSAVRREGMSYDSFGDDGEFCRARGWLLMAYGVSFAAVAGSVLVMLHRFESEDASNRWVGVASVLETAAILGSGLVFYVARAPEEEADYGGF